MILCRDIGHPRTEKLDTERRETGGKDIGSRSLGTRRRVILYRDIGHPRTERLASNTSTLRFPQSTPGGNLTIRRMKQVTGEVWAGIRFPQDIISCILKKEIV